MTKSTNCIYSSIRRPWWRFLGREGLFFEGFRKKMNKTFTKSLIGTLLLLVGLVGMLAACGNNLPDQIVQPVPPIPTVTPLPDGFSPTLTATPTATALPQPTQPAPTLQPTATPPPVVQPAPLSNNKQGEQGGGKGKGKGKKGD